MTPVDTVRAGSTAGASSLTRTSSSGPFLSLGIGLIHTPSRAGCNLICASLGFLSQKKFVQRSPVCARAADATYVPIFQAISAAIRAVHELMPARKILDPVGTVATLPGVRAHVTRSAP